MRLQNGQYDFEKITTFDFEIVALIWSSKEVAQKLRLHNAGAAGNRVESSVGAVVDLFASSLAGRRSMAMATVISGTPNEIAITDIPRKMTRVPG